MGRTFSPLCPLFFCKLAQHTHPWKTFPLRSHGVEAGITFKRTLPLSNLTHPALGFPKALVAVPGHALTPRPGADQLTRNFLPAPRTRPGPPPIPADSRKYGNEMAMAVPCLIRR
jgi:hypothetical protein